MPGPSSIPTHPVNGRANGPSSGRFVTVGNSVMLMDSRGNRWPLDVVSIVTSFWGGGDEGARKLPRPWTYDAAGGVQCAGDLVVIDFLDGDPGKPVVRGVASGIHGDRDFFPYNHAEDPYPANRFAMRLRPVDGDGNELGTVEVEAGLDDGAVVVRASDGVSIEVGPIDAPTVTITVYKDGSLVIEARDVLVEADNVNLGGDVLSDVLVTGTNYTTDQAAAMLEIVAALAVLGTLPAALTATSSFVVNLGLSLTAGAPYLTTKTKAE